ncbi:hypothetical protein [uncultured Bacteroides sp.]|uniref:hypothetical protein n=1 Tax=uncultured Bacteroides sp. TaxID=162156 RepID=UPI0025AF5EA4|nr:hypothetical protein [uncultured Bacteroides sp.]
MCSNLERPWIRRKMSEGNRVKDVKYHASASFDIETDIRVEDDADDLEIFLTIVSDLESRYGLEISYTKG